MTKLTDRWRYFVLLGAMRTGSNLFDEIIRLCPVTDSLGELFNPGFVGKAKINWEAEPDLLKARDADPIAFLNETVPVDPSVLNGFRLFVDHDHRVLDHVLRDENCAKIVLRRDHLDTFISQEIAFGTDQWRIGDIGKRIQMKVAFDPTKFEKYCASVDAFYGGIAQTLKTSGQTAFQISYDDLQDQSVMDGVFRYLGVEGYRSGQQTRIIRQNPEPIEEKVTNPVALAPYLVRSAQPQFHKTSGNDFLGKVALNAATGRGGDISNAFFSDAITDMIAVSETADESTSVPDLAALRDWQLNHQSHRFYIPLEDPLHRAYRAFDQMVLRDNSRPMRQIRRNLAQFYDLNLEGYGRKQLGNGEISLDLYQDYFRKFLIFLEKQLKGQTRTKAEPDWDYQFKRVAALQNALPKAEFIYQSLDGSGADCRLPIYQGVHPITSLMEDDIITSAHKAYSEDVVRFGFTT
ncbi:MAG: hypothetical protein AAF826_06605 [Pseudomonadota bacterium]